MTATALATGRIAHVDTAAVGGQAAWRAGVRVSRGAQIVELNGGDKKKGWRGSKCRYDERNYKTGGKGRWRYEGGIKRVQRKEKERRNKRRLIVQY